MNLKDIELKTFYRSIPDNFIEDFFVPCLKESSTYNRGVGYFTLNGLMSIIEGIVPLIRKKGTIQVLTSPILLESDIEYIEKSADLDAAFIENILERQLDNEIPDNSDLKMKFLSKLISLDFIKIKVVFMKGGIYHEKVGYFLDESGNIVSFIGSTNETLGAFAKNYESMTVFKSWTSREESLEIVEYFKKIWDNKVAGLTAIDLPNAIAQHIIKKYETDETIEKIMQDYLETIQEVSSLPKSRELYDYQKQAINEFINNDYRHFFEMATGTGKTFTAIQAIKEVFEKHNPFVVIVVPQIDLQSQWKLELEKEGFENIRLFGGLADKSTDITFTTALINYQRSSGRTVSIAVYDTFFAKIADKVSNIKSLFLVIDEAHNLSENQIKKLPKNVRFRLGLSATPEKHSARLTKSILSYFLGDLLETYKYTLEDAIKRGYLAKYNYYPIFLNLDEDEFESFGKLTLKLAALINSKDKDEDAISQVANSRSIIVKKAKNKIHIMESLIQNKGKYEFRNSVIYCGQGKTEEGEEKIINLVTGLLRKYNYNVSSFTSETESRHEVLKLFEVGYFDTLVAIKCFDEGIDVPKLDRIYIMSSDKLLRQTIQRRGRVLRVCKETGKELAHIYDLVVLPPSGFESSNISKSLLRMEMNRVKEYMRLAENREVYSSQILSIEDIYKYEESEVEYDEEQEN
jgi:superfamily II DNA or RNA helicase